MVEEEKLDVEKWLQDLKEKAKGEEKLNPFIEMLEKNKEEFEKNAQAKELIEDLMKKHKTKEDLDWEDFIKKYKK